LHTDASHRFERGVDPNAVPAVTARAAALIAALGGGAADAAWVDVYPRPIDGHTVDLRESYLALLLGYDVPTAAVTAALEGVGCRVETAGPPVWKVRTPTHRPDLQMEADLVEEVARLHGYEHIPTRTPRVRPSASGGDQGHALMRRVRAAATGAGLHEAVNYAFVSSDELARAKVETRAIPLQNPLSEERNVLRTSLLPGLLAAVARAQHRQVPDVALFEVGRVFRPMASGHLADEQRVFGCVLAGRARDWIGSKRDVDFFDGKGVVGAVLHPLVRTEGTTSPLKEPAKAPFLHPRRCAEIFVDGTRVGLLGELHPDVNDAFELVGRTVYCEIAIDALVAAIDARGVAKASPLPQFPASRRDLALLVGESVSASEVVDALRDASKPLGESVELFDLYTGEQVAVGHKSLAFRVTYRDPGATLTDDKIDKLHAKVVAAVEKQFGAQTR
ncbi:MAG: phenylalanine--tRNA ligase subunit beta, partial [Myxococcales bacterium]|nr:phenylalanine--tRNA ligase subunit beta [Myxococcales bacterium]